MRERFRLDTLPGSRNTYAGTECWRTSACPSSMMKLHMTMIALLLTASMLPAQDKMLTQDSYARMARRISAALQPAKGERVILRFDPETLAELEPVLRKQLEDRGVVVETIRYGPLPDLEAKLDRAEVYIWLPAGPRAAATPDQAAVLARWLDAGKGRQIHFHWGDGTRATDGLNGAHSAAYDLIYLDALEVDYGALDKEMERVISKMRSGEVRITTPAGTDIRFRVGDRPFCKQNGDASKKRMETARVRIDREIELPSGALRVAPIEESVGGTMVIDWLRIEDIEVTGVHLEFSKGVVIKAAAAKHEDALRRYLDSGPGLKHFREFALGLNPKLVAPRGERWLAYYGYGAGVVRMGLGDNLELGGKVSEPPVRWLFFTDATVQAGGDVLVEGGRIR